MTAPNLASQPTLIFDADDLARTLRRLSLELLEANHGPQDLVLLGLVTRGKPLAERIGRMIAELTPENPDAQHIPVGWLDITLYRDDAGQSFKPTGGSHIPVDITNKRVVLVDDVIFRGRTVRAALDALTAYGRPTAVRLLTLLDRGHRDLPIHPDFVGKVIPSSLSERVNVHVQEIDGEDKVTLQKQ